MATRSEKVTFTGAQGDELTARLDLPDGEPVAYALCAHCFSCTKDIFAAARVAGGSRREGIRKKRQTKPQHHWHTGPRPW